MWTDNNQFIVVINITIFCLEKKIVLHFFSFKMYEIKMNLLEYFINTLICYKKMLVFS